MKLNITIQAHLEVDPEEFREDAEVPEGETVTLEHIKSVLEDCGVSLGDLELETDSILVEEVKE